MRVSSNYLDTAVRSTGATNVVAAILLDFRGYDTLGEATVLFTAVAGVLAVARRIGRIDGKSGEGFSRE
jgi:multisubunit Na+/H+ antiporter MnhB subunit